MTHCFGCGEKLPVPPHVCTFSIVTRNPTGYCTTCGVPLPPVTAAGHVCEPNQNLEVDGQTFSGKVLENQRLRAAVRRFMAQLRRAEALIEELRATLENAEPGFLTRSVCLLAAWEENNTQKDPS